MVNCLPKEKNQSKRKKEGGKKGKNGGADIQKLYGRASTRTSFEPGGFRYFGIYLKLKLDVNFKRGRFFSSRFMDLIFTHAGYNHQRRVLYLGVYLSVWI